MPGPRARWREPIVPQDRGGDWPPPRTIPEEQFCPRCGALLGILWKTQAKLLCEDELIDWYLAQCETDEEER